jgi:endonuclease YncB( thermonuclease family)
MMAAIRIIGLILIVICSVQAEIYRSEDQHGNPVFSDRPTRQAEKIELNHAPYRYKVSLKRVIDGDTLLLESGESIRLIGINTPEVDSRFSHAQPGGKAARAWLQRKLQNSRIWLEYDAERFDKYQRRLAHVFLDSGDYLNAMLLRQGLAMLTLTPPNLRYSERLTRAQQEAEEAGKGVWTMTAYQPKTLADFEPGSTYRGWQRWQVTPESINSGRKYLHLEVNEKLSIHIPKAQLAAFLPVETYLGKPLEVRGWMRRRGDQHHILVSHPSALIQLSSASLSR